MDYIQPFLGTPAFVLAIVLAFALHTLIRRQPPRLIQRHPPPPRSAGFSPFTLLPSEIIQHIASYFTAPSDAASFASTCLCIRLATGTEYLSALHASPTERLRLLELLLADAPNDPIANVPSRLLCVHCARLVPIYIGCGASATEACSKSWVSTECIGSSFLLPLFHTIMAMHRHGRPYDAMLDRLTPPTSTNYNGETGVSSQHTVRYQISAEGFLFQRTQATYIFPPHYDRSTFAFKFFCDHIGGHTGNIPATVALVLDKVCSGSHSWQSDFHWCLTCQTVLLIGARKFRGRGIGLMVTWWRDLGNGLPGDEKWADIIREYDPTKSKKKTANNFMYIVEAFERYNTEDLGFDGLSTLADRKELLRQSPYEVGAGK
ncbi:hypothetical protein V496_08724 [Pseudogymnoascus sp. VKM F-4515 (FW-2607)]|nr:hypothetical protein V496_08724 [Pseudogymnoascus sp. VKM F-4515 (FW-2607)]KFY93026.1 hypothetical protein V498_04598 [Pseudogymnoascus sp. VKM F-4517 (FW-2822)]